MATSNSSPHHPFSTRILPLLLLLLGCCQPSSSATLRPRTDDRWHRPCAGDQAMIIVDDTDEETVTTTTDEFIDAFARLSRRATALKQNVNSLKNNYVLRRFGDAARAAEWVQSGLVVAGSPSWTVSNGNISETLLTCYENLARLSVLTRFVLEGEEAAQTTERHPFVDDFHEIESGHEAGLNVIMCNLHNVMTSWGIEAISSETAAEVSSISLRAPENNAIRHGTAYLVLVVLENSADKLSSSFDRLVGQVASQTTLSTTQ